MNIAGLRVRITIQKNETVVDKYGNHKSAWSDYFSCWATALTSGLSASEKETAGHTSGIPPRRQLSTPRNTACCWKTASTTF